METAAKKHSKSVSLDRYNNSWYNPGNFFKRALWLITNALFFNHSLAVLNSIKIWLLRAFGAKVGEGVLIKPNVNIKYPWYLSIGNNCWIGENVWIDNLAEVGIGNNVCLSQGAMILTGNHDYSKTTFDLIIKSIVIEDGVWIGAKSIVCPGVTCGINSVLTVNSVAVRRLEPDYIYQGNPAVAVKKREIISN